MMKLNSFKTNSNNIWLYTYTLPLNVYCILATCSGVNNYLVIDFGVSPGY